VYPILGILIFLSIVAVVSVLRLLGMLLFPRRFEKKLEIRCLYEILRA